MQNIPCDDFKNNSNNVHLLYKSALTDGGPEKCEGVHLASSYLTDLPDMSQFWITITHSFFLLNMIFIVTKSRTRHILQDLLTTPPDSQESNGAKMG